MNDECDTIVLPAPHPMTSLLSDIYLHYNDYLFAPVLCPLVNALHKHGHYCSHTLVYQRLKVLNCLLFSKLQTKLILYLMEYRATINLWGGGG